MGHKLIDIYEELVEDPEVIYVVPDIERFSRHNTYLGLLYGTLLDASQKPLIQSSSLLTPKLLFRRMMRERSVLHHHWFEASSIKGVLNALWKIKLTWLYRLCGGKVVWTIHNRRPHSSSYSGLNLILRRMWSRLPHRLHVHCPEAVEIMSGELNLPAERFVVIPHPDYPVQIVERDQALQRLAARYTLPADLEQRIIFLMFGYIVPYKGILEAAKIFEDLSDRALLLVAGAVKAGGAGYAAEIAALSRKHDNIILLEQHIPEADVALFFGACSYALFNYQDILASGAAVLARNYGRPVVAPAIGCLKSMSGPDVHLFEDAVGLKTLLQRLGSSSRPQPEQA